MTLNTILILTLISSQLLFGHGQEAKKSFTLGCEFDLIDELKYDYSNVFDQLPVECEAAYNDPILREAMTSESLLFEEFMTALGDREKWEEQVEEEGREILDLNFELRENVYGNSDENCTMKSDTSEEFVECLT